MGEARLNSGSEGNDERFFVAEYLIKMICHGTSYGDASAKSKPLSC